MVFQVKGKGILSLRGVVLPAVQGCE